MAGLNTSEDCLNLMAEHRKFSDIFAHAATGYAVTDVKGNVVEVNKAFARIVGRSPAQIGNANLFKWTHPEDQARHQALLAELLASEIPGFVIEKRYLRPDGSVVWVRNSVSLMIVEQSLPGHLILICEDISDRKRAEQMLGQQEQMASIGRLTSSILHEINNPLEAVFNLVFLARRSATLGEATGHLEWAEEELRRASEITSQGLQFHRQSTSPTSTNVVGLLRSVLTLFRGKLKAARVQVDFRTEDAPELMCFAGEMRQVFVNLIGNAIEAMPGGGQLKVRVRPGTDWRTDEQGVRVTIADTGEGMSIETRKHIYDAFFSTKGSAGSGLGLWVTANIVKKHRGCIHVRSKRLPKTGGSLFNLVFPYRGAEGEAAGLQGHTG
jgi:PAS domain S-box-containing protein